MHRQCNDRVLFTGVHTTDMTRFVWRIEKWFLISEHAVFCYQNRATNVLASVTEAATSL